MNDRRTTGAILLMLFTVSALVGGCGSTSPVAPQENPTVSTPAVPLPIVPVGEDDIGGPAVRPPHPAPTRSADVTPTGE